MVKEMDHPSRHAITLSLFPNIYAYKDKLLEHSFFFAEIENFSHFFIFNPQIKDKSADCFSFYIFKARTQCSKNNRIRMKHEEALKGGPVEGISQNKG